MRCSEFRVRLDQLLDARLDPEMDWNLTSHAGQCEACRDELSGQQLLGEAMDLFDTPELSDSFADEVAAAATCRARPARARSSRTGWLAGIAVAASLLVAFNVLYPALWQKDSDQHLSQLRTNSEVTTTHTPNENPAPTPGQELAGKARSEVAVSEEISRQPMIPIDSELFSFQSFDSDEIPGVRPLKTSLDVTISLLKQTIPGRSSPKPKQPATSQISAHQWYPV